MSALRQYNPGFAGQMPLVRAMLDPYLRVLGAVPHLAWKEYGLRHANYQPDYDKTATTNLVSRGMTKFMRSIPEQLSSFRPWNPGYKQDYLIFEDSTLVRFKKMEPFPSFRTSNVPTGIQQMLRDGEMPNLFGERGVRFLVNVGYTFNPFASGYDKLVVVQWAGRVEWYAEIKFDAEGEASISDVFGTVDMFWDNGDDDDSPNLRLRGPDNTGDNDLDPDDDDLNDANDEDPGDDPEIG